MRSLAPLVLAVLTAALPAQEGVGAVPSGPGRPPIKAQSSNKGGGADEGELLPVKSAEKNGKKIVLSKPHPTAARGLCHFVGSCEPKQIPAGSSGTVLVTMVLEGDAVLPFPAPVTIEMAPHQGPITPGAASFRPAKAATLAPAFRGQLAYDNVAIFEVPVFVDAAAKDGKFSLSMSVKFSLNSAKSGQLIGNYQDQAFAQIEVGPLLAAGAAVAGEVANDGQVVTSAPIATPGRKTTVPPLETRSVPGQLQATAPVAAGRSQKSEEESSAPDAPKVEGDGSLVVVGLVGIGVLLAAGVLVAARRR
jgi:hypothetical protein